jgi:citrate lyase subunit beta/citryl-CoA lyase
VIAAFDAPENAGKGALRIDGRLAERLHRDQALKQVAIADALASGA